jgi:hypothetical protein
VPRVLTEAGICDHKAKYLHRSKLLCSTSGINERTSAAYALLIVPYFPPPVPVLIWSPQCLQVPVPPNGMLQVKIGALELSLQWQRRIQVRHGAINNANTAECVRGRKVWSGKGGYLQSQSLWRLEVEQCCNVSVSIHMRRNGKRDLPRAVAFNAPYELSTFQCEAS